jgi:hypothetical protein
VDLLEKTADLDAECGALYHAAHGLALYHHRICQTGAPPAVSSDRGR